MQIGKIIKIQFTQPPRFFVSLFTTLHSIPLPFDVCMHVHVLVCSFAFLSFGLFYFILTIINVVHLLSNWLNKRNKQTVSHTHPRNLHAQNHTRSLLFLYKLIKSIVASICRTVIEFVSNNIISTCSEPTVCNCYSSNYLAGCKCAFVRRKKQFAFIFDLLLLSRASN